MGNVVSIVGGLLFIGLILVMIGLGNSASCGWRWSGSGYETRWDFFGGCKVEINGRYMPEDRVRAVE